MLTWCRVEDIQNSAVSFLTYSFSVSFFRLFRNSYKDVKDRTLDAKGTATDLDSIQLFFGSIPLVSETYDGGGTLADCDLLTNTILFRQATDTVACGRLAITIRIAPLAAPGRPGRRLSDEFRAIRQEVLKIELVFLAIGD